MMKLSMTYPLATEEPTFILKFSNDLTKLHNYATVVGRRFQVRLQTMRVLQLTRVCGGDYQHCGPSRPNTLPKGSIS